MECRRKCLLNGAGTGKSPAYYASYRDLLKKKKKSYSKKKKEKKMVIEKIWGEDEGSFETMCQMPLILVKTLVRSSPGKV